ncbi:Nuclear nucleic acid-binding protein C1D [Cucurbita argyrosperma subsp. argyrosperma]|nr:Nuclear nucleic acid-binding protein C1D [Cucurbita argyrosperma subsp. argyrosperma]
MEGGVRESAVVPEKVMDSVKMTLDNVEQVQTHLISFLSIAGPDVLAQMRPLQRAQSMLLLSRATTTLFALKLRCSGVHPDDHPIKSELERLSLYQEKLERFIGLSKAPLKRSTTLNYQAATRFIEHSLPDLTQEQKQGMRDISRGKGPKMKQVERTVQKKRKYQSSEKQSVQIAAKEFLEKAARELLGDNNGGLQGPLCGDASNDDLQED